MGVVKIFRKNPNFFIIYNYWHPVKCACVISKFWQSSIHIIIFLLLRLSSLVPVLYTYRVSGSADGDFAVIWYNYYVAGCMQDTFARATHDDRVSCIQRRGQFRAVAKGE